MTAFTKENICSDGEYVMYHPQGVGKTAWEDRKFIARFKHRGPVTKAKFLKVLKKYYTVEDYFAKMDAGRAPLQILQDDNILTFHYGENGARNYFILDGKVI